MTYNIPSPKKQLANLNRLNAKYDFGKKCNKLSEIKNIKLILAFDHLSFSRTKFCFNSTFIDKKKDYLKFLQTLKKISTKTYDELSKNPVYHFHDVNFDETTVSEKDFLKSLVQDITKVDETGIPTVYQFKIFDKARIFGFIYMGVFYPVWFDRNHEVYKRK